MTGRYRSCPSVSSQGIAASITDESSEYKVHVVGKSEPIRVKAVWMNDKSDLLDIRPLKLDISIELPEMNGGKVAQTVRQLEAKEAAERVMTRFRNKINPAVKELKKFAEERYKADQDAKEGVADAAKVVREEVRKTNEMVNNYLRDIRVELRVAISNACRPPLNPKKLITRGSESFTDITLKLGLFKHDSGEAPATFEELEKQLRKYRNDGWVFCVAAVNGTKAFVQLNGKRRIEKKVVDDLKKHVGGSAVKIRGICNINQKKLDFHFAKNSKKQPQKVHIKDGFLKEQIKAKGYTITVQFDLQVVPESRRDMEAYKANSKPFTGDV